MRISVFAIVSVVAVIFAANYAAAMEPKPYVPQQELKKKCAANGGDWNSSSDGGYSCGKKCSNSSGYCVYGCGPNSGGQIECRGTEPEHSRPPGHKQWTIDQVLNNGGRMAPPKAGPLETGPGASPQSPTGIGTPKPSAPPAGKLY